ncbi:DUF1616 domain-containing protein [Natrinema sp. 1APR25-10V2]|uniref:DUF1616 domain-containing protein n=1 Tax=Natrinema sp. 1APR25-10V2 TaxID=2951081 RepID=UPI00287633BF|nr:DUF1616 domain-containing protein [Natrinema sp. 1APR25-10V2]MDS0475118.1 DUF1616 domain-containing protein [Natrinema sp. 1APR25-10V2]
MKGLPVQPFAAVRRRSKRLVAGIPIDLVGVAGFAVIAVGLLAVADVSSPLVRATVGFPLLFFVPGYVTVSTLFPRTSTAAGGTTDDRLLIRQTTGITATERAALSFGLSFALLPLLALVIAATPWGYTGPVVVSTVAGFGLVGSGLATVRRLSVPPADRYRIDFDRRLEAVRTAIFGAQSSLHVAANVVLVLAVVLALTTAGYAFVAPQDDEQYTSLRLLTETDSGELVASGYPSEIEPGESVPLVVAVENREEADRNYTVVVQQQRLQDGEVIERTELQRFSGEVTVGSTAYAERNVTPTADEGPVRISVLLYADGVPETPTHENAYRYTHVWTNVTEPDDTDTGDSADGTGGEDDSGDDPFDDLFDDESDESSDGGTDGGTDDGGDEAGTDSSDESGADGGDESSTDSGDDGDTETVDGDSGGSGNETEG